MQNSSGHGRQPASGWSYLALLQSVARFYGLLILLLVVLVVPLLVWMARRAHANGLYGLIRSGQLSFSDPLYVVLVLAELAAAVAAVGLSLRRSRMSWAEAGLAAPHDGVRNAGFGVTWRLLLGSAIGMASFSIMPLLAAICGWARLAPSEPGAAPWITLPLVVGALLPSAAFGEIIVRGPALALLARRSPLLGVAVTTLVFALIHLANPGFDRIAELEMVMGGIVLAVARLRSGSLWLPIGWHFGWNLAEGWLFGCITSGAAPSAAALFKVRFTGPGFMTGASFGPESGLFAFAADFLTLLAYLAVTGSRGRR